MKLNILGRELINVKLKMNTRFKSISKGDIKMEFNTNQKEAIHTIDGNMVVIAAAGSGKTSVLTYRILNTVSYTHLRIKNCTLPLSFTISTLTYLNHIISSQIILTIDSMTKQYYNHHRIHSNTYTL